MLSIGTSLKLSFGKELSIVKLVLETTCIKQATALRNHCTDTTPALESTQ